MKSQASETKEAMGAAAEETQSESAAPEGRFPLLSRIDSPEDLRGLPEAALPSLAEEIRGFMVESVSKTGGHLSSSLGAVELAIALQYVFNTDRKSVV